MNVIKRTRITLAIGTSLLAMFPAVAWAQSAPNDTPSTDQSVDTSLPADITVTGTLIRGIAPAGSQVISVSQEQVAASGGTSTNQILSTIPQVGNFFNQMQAGVSAVAGANATNPIARPNLRNLPGADTSGGAQTLVLLDGHRLVGAGITQVAVDPDVIAPGVIERVEALTDGGSAVYGSDALGGVLNFITRRKFDGVKVNARYSFGDDYMSVDGGIMAGKDWGTGGLYVAYGYSHHDAVFGSDRDFAKQINWSTGVPTGRNCANPNATANGHSYVASGAGLVAGGPNVCDYADDVAIYPASTLHTAFARLTQDLSDSVHFDVTAQYAHRRINGFGGTPGNGALGTGANGAITLNPGSPGYRALPGADAGAPETVTFNYGPLFGNRGATLDTNLESWSVAPQLSFDLGKGWQIRTLFSYGQSLTSYHDAQIDGGAQAAAIANGTLDPFNIAATSPTVAATLLRDNQGNSRNELFDYRAIIDGPLVKLPGGDVHVAAGYEHMQDNFKLQTTNATTYALQSPNSYTQKVDSVFGEVQVPLFGSDNATTLLHELTFDVSARYDRYSDFGHTFNPKFAATWRPVDWIAIKGSWGKSFTAPSPVDQLNVLASTVGVIPAQFLNAAPPGLTALPNEVGLFVAGTAQGIEPQKAKNWSIGVEVKPPIIEGLTANLSYYKIDLNGTIGRPISGPLAPFYANFPQLFIARPTGQQLAAYLSRFDPANVGFTLVNPTSASQAVVSYGGTSSPVLVTLDSSARNLGTTVLSGLDFALNYVRPTSFGSIDAGFAGNYRLTQNSRSSPVLPLVDDLAVELIRMTFQATAGVNIGNLRAQVIWNHSSGYRRSDAGTAGAFGQVNVKAFDTVNLFGRYVLPEAWVGKDTEVTLNVQNLFNVAPPEFLDATQYGYDRQSGHGFTIGRIVQLGVSKKF